MSRNFYALKANRLEKIQTKIDGIHDVIEDMLSDERRQPGGNEGEIQHLNDALIAFEERVNDLFDAVDYWAGSR